MVAKTAYTVIAVLVALVLILLAGMIWYAVANLNLSKTMTGPNASYLYDCAAGVITACVIGIILVACLGGYALWAEKQNIQNALTEKGRQVLQKTGGKISSYGTTAQQPSQYASLPIQMAPALQSTDSSLIPPPIAVPTALPPPLPERDAPSQYSFFPGVRPAK